MSRKRIREKGKIGKDNWVKVVKVRKITQVPNAVKYFYLKLPFEQ